MITLAIRLPDDKHAPRRPRHAWLGEKGLAILDDLDVAAPACLAGFLVRIRIGGLGVPGGRKPRTM